MGENSSRQGGLVHHPFSSAYAESTANAAEGEPSRRPSSMLRSGPLVLCLMLGVALAMSLFACWYHYDRSRKAMDFWGSEAAYLVRRAENVELWPLVPVGQSRQTGPPLTIGETQWAPVDRLDIRSAAGLLHARHALVQDQSFAWDEPADPRPARWDAALRFADESDRVTLVLDFSRQRLRFVEADREISMAPVADGLQLWLRPWLENQTRKATAD